MNWPALEALMCHGPDARSTSRRVGAFNMNWSLTGALAVAVVSRMVAVSPAVVFVGVAVATAGCFCAVLLFEERETNSQGELHAEPALLARQTLAKSLARLALPASYTILYSLTPILATLPAVRALPASGQSVAVSVWLVARFLCFCGMAATSGWHTRPRLLVAAVVTVLGAFLLAAIPAPGLSLRGQLGQLVTGQVLVGVGVAFIYYCSLYFGMVLSHGGNAEGGSTEQGGYHEALIGGGIILGPSLAVVASMLALPPALGAVVVIGAASVACGWVSVRSGSPKNA
jgi:hypothetical protein